MPRLLSPSGRFVNPLNMPAVTRLAVSNAANPMGVSDAGGIQPDTIEGSITSAARSAQDLAQHSLMGGNPGGTPSNAEAPTGPFGSNANPGNSALGSWNPPK